MDTHHHDSLSVYWVVLIWKSFPVSRYVIIMLNYSLFDEALFSYLESVSLPVMILLLMGKKISTERLSAYFFLAASHQPIQ